MDNRPSDTYGDIFKGELADGQVVKHTENPQRAERGPAVVIGNTDDVNAHEHRHTNTPIYKEEPPT